MDNVPIWANASVVSNTFPSTDCFRPSPIQSLFIIVELYLIRTTSLIYIYIYIVKEMGEQLR